MKPKRKGRGADAKGRSKKGEHFAKLLRPTLETPAWKALSCAGQALYPWLKLEWHGPSTNNNGRISLSVRQAAERLGVSDNTAARAFHDLQAKGFIVVQTLACLGTNGHGRSNEYELTELAMPNSGKSVGRQLYREWAPENDFKVIRAQPRNPDGQNGQNKTLSQF